MSKVTQPNAPKSVFNFLLFMWTCNLGWLLLMLWGVEYCIHEQGMDWMEKPQYYSLWFCSITKVFLSLVLVGQYKLLNLELG